MSITINEHLTEALKKLGIANLRPQQEAPDGGNSRRQGHHRADANVRR